MHRLCLKLNLLIASLFGFLKYKPSKKSPVWLQFSLTLYYNTYFVTIFSFFLIYLSYFPLTVVKHFEASPFTHNVPKILHFICAIVHQLWRISYLALLLTLRLTLYSNHSLLKKLYFNQKWKSKTDRKDYGIFIFTIGLKLYYILCYTILKANSDFGHCIVTFTDFAISFNAATNNINLLDILFCIVLYISAVIDTLGKKIVELSKQVNNYNKNLLWDSVIKKVISLKEITEEFYSRMHLVICVFFLYSFIYMFSFITKFATESNGELKEVLINSEDFLYIFLTLLLLDMPQRKVC